MKKNILVFGVGVITGALGMKVAPKLMSSLKRDDSSDVDEILDEFDELVDEFDNIVDSFEEPNEAPTAEPTEEPSEAPTPETNKEPSTPSPENGEEEKGGENNE